MPIGAILFYVQFRMFRGNCLLTLLEFGWTKEKISCHYYYLTKYLSPYGIVFDHDRTLRFIDFYLPGTLFLVALFWQIVLERSVLII